MKRLSVLLILAACAFAQKPDKPLKNGLYAIFNTELGKFTAQLYEKDTPNSVRVFKELAEGTLASRDCGFTIRDEILPGLTFSSAGKLAVANAGPDTGGCQFFVTTGPVASWNGNYTIFGQVVEGLDVVGKIGKVPVHGDQPVEPVKLISVTIQRVGPEPAVKPPKK
jgi:cyclophilin family peptidyl-prolyl cis-trans isomerase